MREREKGKEKLSELQSVSASLRLISKGEEIDRKQLKKALTRSLILQIADDPSSALKATELLVRMMGWGAEKKPNDDHDTKKLMSAKLDEMLRRART